MIERRKIIKPNNNCLSKYSLVSWIWNAYHNSYIVKVHRRTRHFHLHAFKMSGRLVWILSWPLKFVCIFHSFEIILNIDKTLEFSIAPPRKWKLYGLNFQENFTPYIRSTPCFFGAGFHIILPSMAMSPKWCVPFRFCDYNSVCVSPMSNAWYMPHPSHLSLFGHTNYT
jgi:hypothetical protein